MADSSDSRSHPRTLLEVKIRERNLTLDEFADYAETFARENGETGTLSTRHLQRLVAPPAGKARPVPRPATRRLLERIFDAPIVELLGPPTTRLPSVRSDVDAWGRGAADLTRRLAAAERVDPETIDLLATQIDTTRRLDRRFGAATLLGTLRHHAEHIEHLLAYCTNQQTRCALSAVLTDAHTLAGWQSLDRGEIGAAWRHYERACDGARAAESSALLAHALAEQAVVLADIGRSSEAAQLSGHTRVLAADGPPLLLSWLAAAHGEALAADDEPDASMHAFEHGGRPAGRQSQSARRRPLPCPGRGPPGPLARPRTRPLRAIGRHDRAP
jgi:hypothetical protein